MKNLTSRLTTPLAYVALATGLGAASPGYAIPVGSDGRTPLSTYSQELVGPEIHKVQIRDEKGNRLIPVNSDESFVGLEGKNSVVSPDECAIIFTGDGSYQQESDGQFYLTGIPKVDDEKITRFRVDSAVQQGNSYNPDLEKTPFDFIENPDKLDPQLTGIEAIICNTDYELGDSNFNPFLASGKLNKLFDATGLDGDEYSPLRTVFGRAGDYTNQFNNTQPYSGGSSSFGGASFGGGGGSSLFINKEGDEVTNIKDITIDFGDIGCFVCDKQPPHFGNGGTTPNGGNGMTTPMAPIPLPGAGLLLLSGIGALGYAANRKRRREEQ